MDIGFKTSSEYFSLRSAALVIFDNRLLVAKNDKFDCFYIVGGGIHENESSAKAVVRELYEEILEQALDALLENIPADRQLHAKNTFLRGYQSIKTLEPDYTEKLKLMRRFCNLYSYARLIRCVAEEYSNEPDWMVALREKLHWKIRLLESGVTGQML